MSNGYLTTHVLDIYNGTPGKGIKGEIYIIENNKKNKIKEFNLNNEGRSESPILNKEEFRIGKYELVFYCGEYFNKFTNINDTDQHYHVPLLVSPWSYSTYRGS